MCCDGRLGVVVQYNTASLPCPASLKLTLSLRGEEERQNIAEIRTLLGPSRHTHPWEKNTKPNRMKRLIYYINGKRDEEF